MSTRSVLILLLCVLLAAWFWSRKPASPAAPAGDQVLDVLTAPEPIEAPPATPAVPPPVAATSARGIAFRVRQREPIGLPEPPYGPAYQRLLPAAEAGDVQAQYELGLVLYECRDLPETAEALAGLIESVHQTRRRDGWPVEDPDTESAELRRRHGLCQGVPEAERGAYRAWLLSAADAGLLEAQLKVQYALPQADYCQYLWECSPAQRAFQASLQAEALRYVTQAREAGSAEALWTFAAWYLSDEVLAPDEAMAYAHFLALDEVYAAAGHSQRFEVMLSALEERLRPVDLERARSEADRLLSNPACCVIVP